MDNFSGSPPVPKFNLSLPLLHTRTHHSPIASFTLFCPLPYNMTGKTCNTWLIDCFINTTMPRVLKCLWILIVTSSWQTVHTYHALSITQWQSNICKYLSTITNNISNGNTSRPAKLVWATKIKIMFQLDSRLWYSCPGLHSDSDMAWTQDMLTWTWFWTSEPGLEPCYMPHYWLLRSY